MASTLNQYIEVVGYH